MFQTLQQMQHNASKLNSTTDPSVELKKIASEKGFTISENQGSGNCMFYALSDQLNLVKRIKMSHKELRQSIVQYLRKNPQMVSFVFVFLGLEILNMQLRKMSVSYQFKLAIVSLYWVYWTVKWTQQLRWTF